METYFLPKKHDQEAETAIAKVNTKGNSLCIPISVWLVNPIPKLRIA